MATRILVTGGAGFIGSHYVRSLLKARDDVSVTVLDKLTYAGNRANLGPVRGERRFRFVRGDICDPDVVDALVREADQVVHFAAESHVDRSIYDADRFLRTNILGTQVLLEAALRHELERFVHISTDEVYGSLERGSWSEAEPVRPNSPYAASKASSDLIALSYHATHGLDVRVTRCCNNYGPYQFPEKVIPLFVTNLLTGRKAPLYGDGSNVREWLHTDDHVRAVELVRTRGAAGEIYNIGSDTELTNRELTAVLLEGCGAGWDMVEMVADRPGHDLRYSVDWAKARTQLGYSPRRDFAAGIAETIEWYRRNRDWWEPLKRAA
ncbi:dTDP-glucose 4,6-dehydratase [Thermomonospora echinospora]|uniref:dTDP-glucose 4,6-dehydratase n=1 Tax=Thermomonospora echinospora TaxID=1992 RepID=A0A1H6DE82_9ACTN|nr:dTDP-glucose 4,6-dehydratase [Thermomonospora echinospora]SEG83688.1 dTDP-glucose 4,6-dehydratase [Thermomonospora echinospora]